MSDQMSWSVTVEREGEAVVTLSSNGHGGRDISPDDEVAIRTAAQHLLSFIGLAAYGAERETTESWNAPDANNRTPVQRLQSLVRRLQNWDDAPIVTESESEELLLDIKQCLGQVVPLLASAPPPTAKER